MKATKAAEPKDTTYNGWTNYETWCVKLWIDNEQGSYDYWRERTREVWDAAEADTILSRSQRARYDLQEALKDEHQEAAPEMVNVFGDLLGAALSEVDWREIADSMLCDMAEGADESEDCREYEGRDL